MKRETLLGLVGVAVLLVAMVAVFRFEAAQGATALGPRAFAVGWTIAEAPGPQAKGFVASHATNRSALDVPSPNLTRAVFALTWTDDVGGPDTFRFTVAPPAGASRTVEGASGNLTLAFEGLNDVPPPTTAYGDSPAQAAARLAEKDTKRAGAGAWTVVVECIDAVGTRLPVPGSPELQPDPGNDYRVRSTLTAYAPRLVPT